MSMSGIMISRIFRGIAKLCLTGALAACATVGSELSPQFEAVEASQEGQVELPGDYKIGPLDVLEVVVFQIDDMNRRVRVDESGDITLPLIGPVQAAGATITELEDRISAALERDYVRNPQVSVFVSASDSRRVTVSGQVMKPGIYPIVGRTTLLQALALAQGLSEVATSDGVVIFRNQQGRKLAAIFDLDEISAGNLADPEVIPGDLIVVEKSVTRQLMRDLGQTVPILGIFSGL